MTTNDGLSYDENDALAFILNYIPQELKSKISDDDVLYILDLVDEFYESKGDYEPSDTEYEQFEKEMLEFIVTNSANDHIGPYNAEEIGWILDAEVEYCESLGL
ncbi:MAG: hypothetical protein LBC81_03150 [Tannerellaceae bacterium]|jgi:CCR4-NOT transcriptional regulation complex NOT5 subunit|nr:hypothetical protein [Tannerellaceae bacterium]